MIGHSLHRSDAQTNGYKSLEAGEHVSFTIEPDPTRRAVAGLVTPLGGPPPPIPAHGHMWATVPEVSAWYPFHLQVAKTFGTTYPDGPEYDEFIAMYISVNWSFWSQGEGKAMLDQALDRLFRQGWREANPDPGTSRQ